MIKQNQIFMNLAFLMIPLLVCTHEAFCQSVTSSSILDVDYRELVSRADLRYEKPVSYNEEGLPVGNGTMGSIVWTSPSALRFQINRVDVYATNSSTKSFNKRHSDYCGGTGYVDVDFVDFGRDVFPEERTIQHLSVYDGLLTVEGDGIIARVLAWQDKDVMAIEVDDQRVNPVNININLRMLRLPEVQTKHHTALSSLGTSEGNIFLTQEFTEGDYFCGSAVVIGISEREGKARMANDTEIRLSAEPGNGKFTFWIASAASFDPDKNLVAIASEQLKSAAAKGFENIYEYNSTWWAQFWEKSFIDLHSDDGTADFIEEHYTFYLYVMASSSRGVLPPKFNGMLWNSRGDIRIWGSQHWWHNVSTLYLGLPAANHYELMDPVFDMYTNMYDACALSAQQQWDSKGIFIPETVSYNGHTELPEDVAENMRDLYLLRIPWEERTKEFEDYAWSQLPHSSRWNWKAPGSWVDGHWIVKDKGSGQYGIQAGPYGHVFGHVVHIFSSGAKIAYQYWLRYDYTRDEDWLRERAYPMLKGITEFYRNYPNLKKGEDGKYHLHHVNNHEPIWDTHDPMEEMAALHGILPLTIKASEILGIDKEMRPVWTEFLENLAPMPRNDMKDVLNPGKPGEEVMWSNGFQPTTWILGGESQRNQHTIIPAIHYDLCNLETDNQEIRDISNATFDAIYPEGPDHDRPIWVIDYMPIAAALLGRPDFIKTLIPSQLGDVNHHKNRLSHGEGSTEYPGTTVEGQGVSSRALQMALCQDVPPGPGEEPVIRVFAAWPKEWDASYTLLTRKGFLVTSSMQQGQVKFVEIQPQLGGECRIHNPWGESELTVFRNGKKWKDMDSALLVFNTKTEDDIILVPKGSSPDQYKRTIR